MSKYLAPDYIKAYLRALNNRKKLLKDEICGCFACETIFHTYQIKHWIEDDEGTALCPYCQVDAVLGESCGYPITREFLQEMNIFWFGGISDGCGYWFH